MITLRFKRLLVPVDFSITSKKAIIHAAALARKEEGSLILLHVASPVSTGSFFGVDLQAEEETSEIRKKLKKLSDEVSSKYKVPVQGALISGRTVSAIASAAERYCADMIVMGTNGYESESSLFSGSISTRVIGKTSLPVLTIRADSTKDSFSKILLPISLSSHSRQKVNAAIKLASLFGASVHMTGLLPKGAEEDLFKMEIIQKQVREMAESRNIPFTYGIHFTDSPVSKTLAQARRLRAELIISMTDEDVSDTWFSSEAFDRELVNESPFPILSIKPEIHDNDPEMPSMAGIW